MLKSINMVHGKILLALKEMHGAASWKESPVRRPKPEVVQVLQSWVEENFSHDILEEGFDEGWISQVPKSIRWGGCTKMAYTLDMQKLGELAIKDSKEPSQVTLLRRRVKELELELESHRELLDFNKKFEIRAKKTFAGMKVSASPKYKGDSRQSALLFLSDLHIGETVNGFSINNVNEYNVGIARKRMSRVVRGSLEALFREHQNYEAAFVLLGGDMVSGTFLDELVETNEVSPIDAIYIASELVAQAIVAYAQSFEKVFVRCVPGNHGRMTKKYNPKTVHSNNADLLVYRSAAGLVAQKLGPDANVFFEGMSKNGDVYTWSPESIWTIYDKRYMLVHGERFDSNGGATEKVINGMRARMSQGGPSDNRIDYMLCGHFHQYSVTQRTVINGSLKGYDEHAASRNLSVEPPCQALMIASPGFGISRHLPVYAEDPQVQPRKLALCSF